MSIGKESTYSVSDRARWNIYTVLGFQGLILVINIHRATEFSISPRKHTSEYDTGSRIYLNSSLKRQLKFTSLEGIGISVVEGMDKFPETLFLENEFISVKIKKYIYIYI